MRRERNERQALRPKGRRGLAGALAALLAAAALSAGSPIPAAAAPVDLAEPGSLTAEVPEEFKADLNGKAIDLYRVAAAVETPGYDSYGYRLLEPYEKLEMKKDPTNEDWSRLAQEAAEIALAGETPAEPDVTGAIGEKTGELEAGLYLLVVRGEVQKPEAAEGEAGGEAGESGEAGGIGESGSTEAPGLVTALQTDRYLYTFAPELISLPAKEAVDGVVSTANPGDWVYDMTALLKPAREDRLGSLEIVKTLEEQSLTQEPATFVFQVDAYLDEDGDGTEENVFSDVVGMTFTGTGDESVTLAEKIPVGARVVVEEIYSGASYTAAGSQIQEGTMLAADQLLSVAFTNTNDDHHRGGNGITNSFAYSSDQGWQWEADPEQND